MSNQVLVDEKEVMQLVKDKSRLEGMVFSKNDEIKTLKEDVAFLREIINKHIET